MKRLLKKEIDSTTKLLKQLKMEISDIKQQVDSDEITEKFLRMQIADFDSKLAKTHATTEQLISDKQKELAQVSGRFLTS